MKAEISAASGPSGTKGTRDPLPPKPYDPRHARPGCIHNIYRAEGERRECARDGRAGDERQRSNAKDAERRERGERCTGALGVT